jgi:PAS domain-containing protein
MAQPIELILVRHLASRLTIPTLLTDVEGTLVFYNEAAEPLLGRRFDEAGEMAFDEWTSAYAVRDESGQLVRSEQIPLVRALRSRRPIHVRIEIIGLDGTPRMLEVSAFPLVGQGDQRLGAVTFFWESQAEEP